MKRYFIIFLSVFALLSCASKRKNTETNKEEKQTVVEEKQQTKQTSDNQIEKLKAAGYTIGEIKDKTGLDGCSFVIETEDQKTYEPKGLKPEFQKANLKIAFKFRPSRAMSTCMIGKPIAISEVKVIQ